MGSISSIPLKEEKELYLLCLVPSDRIGMFLYEYHCERRCILLIHETQGLVNYQIQAFEVGGALRPQEGKHNLSDLLLARATRIVEREFKKWDDLRIMERINLQIAWAEDALRRAENDLLYALECQYENAKELSGPRWDLQAVQKHLDRVRDLSYVLEGVMQSKDAL